MEVRHHGKTSTLSEVCHQGEACGLPHTIYRQIRTDEEGKYRGNLPTDPIKAKYERTPTTPPMDFQNPPYL
ncbi:Hypothetical predicted protein, partial [Pelobates cultripes]